MFKLNFKIAWRNLLKNKGYAAINIVGLSLGLAGFIFMMLFINHEKSYDTWDKELKNVYQVQEYSDYQSQDKKAHWKSSIDYRFAQLFTDKLPEVKATTIIDRAGRTSGITTGTKAFLEEDVRRSDSSFFAVMPYKFIYGSAERAFSKPNTVVLRKDVAEKYFGNINPVGKVITIAGGNWRGSEDKYTVSGVVDEPSTPSVMRFSMVFFEGNYEIDNTSGYGPDAEVYVRTIPVNEEQFNQKVMSVYIPLKSDYLSKDHRSMQEAVKAGNKPFMRVTKLENVYQQPLEGSSWLDKIEPVILLSLLLLVVSVINFVNLATAQAASRAKEIGVKKVIGAFRRSLIYQFLTETFIQCLIALFIALFLIELALPSLNALFTLNLSLIGGASFKLFVQLIGIIIVVALLTGAYPAVFLSAYKPSEVLKGNFSAGKGGGMVRKGLVAAQFVVSVSFIIGILVVNYQLKYLKSRDNGFSTAGMINIRSSIYDRNDKWFNAIKRIDGVKNVAFSSGVIGDYVASSQTFKYKDESVELYGQGMGIEGMQALDARLIAGRFFSKEIAGDTISNAIINQSAAKSFGKSMVGQTIMAYDSIPVNIVGVVKDIQVESFESAAKPSIYVVEVPNRRGRFVNYTTKQTTLVRFDPSKTKEVVEGIGKIFTEMNAFYPMNYSFVETDLKAVLADHERFEKMVAVFSFLSLSLSLFGLFSLAAFITRQRTKEIAVRKVLGAENTDILVLLNKGYAWIVIIANAIAMPVTYILVKKWLSAFAYRVDISAMPFIAAFAASVIITIITVSLQARKAIRANPVNALKYE